MASKRKPGISVLIAAQNEEAIISLCIRSFLEFGDELIIVDNGSTDHTKEIVRQLEAQYPKKIKFYDAPHLVDLYHNRQYAFERSSYEWVVRADSDFVAYTNGEYDIMRLREYLLSRSHKLWPLSISVPLPNVSVDFWHTGKSHPRKRSRKKEEIRYIAPAVTGHRRRIYRPLPFFRFQRVGRWEAVRFSRLYRIGTIRWDNPIWMHCNLKSDMNYFLRSERTNWRQLGNFKRFATLQSYIESVMEQTYGTNDINEAARLYMERRVLPNLEPYDPGKYYPYPSLVLEQMQKNPIYRICSAGGRLTREFYGIGPIPTLDES